MRFTLLLSLVLSLFFVSCDKNKKTDPEQKLQIVVNPVFGSQVLYLDSVYYTSEGYAVKFTDIKFFLSALHNGVDTLSLVGYYDLREKGNLLLEEKGEHSKFHQLAASIGVITPYNNADPSLFPNNSPLNISNAGNMHWSWNTGYIFYAIEGRVDTIPDNVVNTNLNFSFHIGMNQNLRSVQFENLNWVKKSNELHQASLKLDMGYFLNNPNRVIDLKSEYLTHTASGQEQLTTKVVSSFKESLTAE